MKKTIFLLVVALLGSWLGHAQIGTVPVKIQVSAVSHQGFVRVRWVPADLDVFQKGNQYGYQVTRRLLAVNGVPLSTADQNASATTLGSPYLTLTEAQWDLIAVNNNLAGVAEAAIYADEFVATPGNDAFYQAVNESAQGENRYGFGLFAADQSFMIARYMGLGLIDSTAVNLNPQGEYSYTVEVLTPGNTARPKGIGRIVVSQAAVLPTINNLTVTTGVGNAILSFPRGDLERYYTSYIIERSVDGGAIWQRRNNDPLMFLSNNAGSERMIFHDTIEQPDVAMKYRIKGHSPFDIDGPASNVVEGTGKSQSLGIYPELNALVENNAQFVLNWAFPAANNQDILKFQIYRSDNPDGNFVLLGETGVTARQYTDISPSAQSNYYKVVAIDNKNYPNESIVKLAQLNDTTSPDTPVGLSATVDKDGLVTISWTANLEPDLKGYRVFFSNNPDNDFAQITTTVLTATTYTHQLELKVLGKKVYYKVLATDFRENDSDYSASVSVDRPDIMAPMHPMLVKADPLPLGVQLQWVPSSSTDVAKHSLQRRVKNDISWVTLTDILPGQPLTTWMDSTTTGVREFSYRVVATDSSGNAAVSTQIDVKPVRNNPDTISLFKVASAVEGVQKQAKLTWQYLDAASVMEFQIYRSMDGSALHLYKTFVVNPEDLDVDPVTKRALFVWRDKEIDTNNTYGFKVLAKFRDGSSSAFSRLVNFTF